MGLAILHFATRGQSGRSFILWGGYLALIFPVTSLWAALLLILLAAIEPLLPWRRAPTAHPPPGS